MCDIILTPVNNGEGGSFFPDETAKGQEKLIEGEFYGDVFKFELDDVENSDQEFSCGRESNIESDNESTLKCLKCGKEFIQICSLQFHDHFYCDNNTWICDFTLCDKRFNLQEHLDIHKRVHVINDEGKEEVIRILQPDKCYRSAQNGFKASNMGSNAISTIYLPSSSDSTSLLSTCCIGVGNSVESSWRNTVSPPIMSLELDDEEHGILFAPVHENGQVDLHFQDFQYDVPVSPLLLVPSTTSTTTITNFSPPSTTASPETAEPTTTTTTTTVNSRIGKGILKRSSPSASPYSHNCSVPMSQSSASKRQRSRCAVTFAENVYVLTFRSYESICPRNRSRRSNKKN